MRILLLLIVLVVLPRAADGQPRSHVYVSAGAGATDLSGGADVLLAGGPVGIGGELGAGNLFLASVNGTYHPLAARAPARIDPFATIGLMALGSSERSLTGVNLGGGLVVWLKSRVGLRFDGFRFMSISTRYDVPVNQLSPARYWGVRAGVSFGF